MGSIWGLVALKVVRIYQIKIALMAKPVRFPKYSDVE
jgi:hypothetical protein